MANAFNSEVSQVNKSSGHGPKDKPTKAASPSLNMKTGPFRGKIGKAGPNRNSPGWRRVKQHTQSSGV